MCTTHNLNRQGKRREQNKKIKESQMLLGGRSLKDFKEYKMKM